MRIVLDTGILIAALITTGTPPDLIYQAWRKQRFTLITSEWQLAEFRRVSRYPKLAKFLKPVEAGEMVNSLRRQALLLEELPRLDLSPDPDDNYVLAMAVAGQADFLVTGDKRDLLALGRIQQTSILTARAFVERLAIAD
ncbi:MAG: putative toxin-antitoxin system toxin component, PIN family [Candidatus Competibacteraceae bacterium]